MHRFRRMNEFYVLTCRCSTCGNKISNSVSYNILKGFVLLSSNYKITMRCGCGNTDRWDKSLIGVPTHIRDIQLSYLLDGKGSL